MLIKIKILSDTICPWCYIGKKSFDYAKNHFDSNLFQITWVPFQLNPDMPKEGMDRRKYLIRKFGNQNKTIETYTPIIKKFQENNIDHDLSKILKTPNTMNSNLLIHWGQLENKANQIVENLFNAYFYDGIDLGNKNHLIKIAKKSGLTKKLSNKLFENKKDINSIQELENKYRRIGVTGIPTFILNNEYVIPGAQTKEFWLGVFEEVIEQNRRSYS